MSGVKTNVVRGNGNELRRFTACWRPNGVAAPLDVEMSGGGTVVRTGVGLFSVRFSPGVIPNAAASGTGAPRLRGIGAFLQFAGFTVNQAIVGGFALQTNGEFWIDVGSANGNTGAAVETGPDPNIRISFWIETDELPGP